jgi:hypothetical protein
MGLNGILAANHVSEAILKIRDGLGRPSRPPPIASASFDFDIAGV